MDKFIVVIVSGLALVIGVLAFSLLMLAGGAAMGWLAGIIFPATASKIVAATGLATYQWGAIVAFVGAYFRTTVNKS
jgi:hypothetical protein